MARIVVMDDEEGVRHVLARALELQGHEVLEFEDARPALDEVNFKAVDLVVTDLQMPTTGDQVIRELKERGVDVPVMVLSGHLDNEKADALRALGVRRVMSKPFDLFGLLEAVEECL